MNKHCNCCNQNFEPEPGFYYGAMYLTYVVSTAVSVVVGLTIFYGFNDPPMWVYFLSVLAIMVLLAPVSYRHSRSIMLHMFGGIKFDSKYRKPA